jgi:hypothetical protein
MSIVSDADLQSYSDLAAELALKDTCEILSQPSGTDTWGGGDETSEEWDVSASVRCAVIDAGGMPIQATVAQQESARMQKIILFPRGTEVTGANRVRVVGGDTYEVVDVIDPTSYEVVRRVCGNRVEVGP